MKNNLIRCGQRNAIGEIDPEKGIIFGASLITGNREALGHQMYIDEDTVAQVVSLAKEKEPTGLKARFDHPSASSRAMGTFIGRWHNVRRDGLHARGDIHIAEASSISPDGNLKSYVVALAEEDPLAFATSIVFRPDDPWVPDSKNKGKKGFPPEDDPFWFPHARVKALHQCDVVDEAAANEGLFSENAGIFGRPDYWPEQILKYLREHSEIADYLISQSEDRKQAKAERKEDMTELKEALDKIAELENTVVTITAEKTELATAAKEHAGKVTIAHDEGLSAGVEQERANFKRRLEKFDKDSEFVIECLELSDAEAQEKYIERLKKKIALKPKGPAPIDGDADGDDPVKPLTSADGDDPVTEYNEKLAEYVEKNDGKRGTARKLMARNHPKLHAAFVASQGPGDKPE